MMSRFIRVLAGAVLLFAMAGGSAVVAAEKRSQTNLPYRFPQVDGFGNTWMLYNGGRLMQQGNMPFCSDTASLLINGQGAVSNVQTAALEGNEVVLENMRVGQLVVSRRFSQQEDGVLRICEVIRNNRPQEISANVTLNFNVNFGVQMTRQLTDPKKTDRTLANLVTDSQGRMALSVLAGRGAKVTPTINAQPNNNQIQATMEVKIPTNKEVAIVHFHLIGVGQEQADKLFAQLSEARALSSLPPEIRKILVNYPAAGSVLDDLEILRGGASDVIELNNADQLKGDLLAESWDIEASFGKVSVPANQMAGLITAGGIRPRQLLVTTDGEIIGGRLLADGLAIQLSSGQKVTVPTSQVSRIGRRSPATEAPETRPVRPMLQLRSGDRLSFQPPGEPLRIATRFGTLALAASSLAAIDLQPDQSPVHVITLTDGSRFSGVLLADSLDLNLTRGGKLSFPAATIRKISFAGEPESDDSNALLRLSGDDVLAAGLPAKFTVVTAYGDLEVNGAEVKRIARVKDSSEELQVILWDDSQISGRLQQPFLQCTIAGNTIARVPVGAIESYTCSAPQPSSAMVERIRKLIGELNADDWKQRERAEADLLAMGAAVMPSLKELRAQQPPEAQQRIDSIIKQLNKSPTAKPSRSAGPGAAIMPRIID